MQIIVVDDGSKDATAEVASSYSEIDERIKLLKLGVNRGKGGAIKRGVQAALGRYILMVSLPHHRLVHAPLPHLAQVDADGATDIRDLDNLWLSVQKIERKIHSESCGVAIGSRCLLFFLSLV